MDPSYISIGALFLIAAAWGVAFGWVSRRFERQADVFGARTVTPPPEGCVVPCKVHHEANDAASEAKALCATGAHTFAAALRRIAALNGIPEEARSWRHSSIASRMRFLEALTLQGSINKTKNPAGGMPWLAPEKPWILKNTLSFALT